MSLVIPPDIDERVQSQVAAGRYRTGDDVLRAALTALEREHEDLTAIEAGLADVEAGRFRPFVEIDAEFRRQHNVVTQP